MYFQSKFWWFCCSAPNNFEGICVAKTSVVSFGNLLLNTHLHFGFPRVFCLAFVTMRGGGGCGRKKSRVSSEWTLNLIQAVQSSHGQNTHWLRREFCLTRGCGLGPLAASLARVKMTFVFEQSKVPGPEPLLWHWGDQRAWGSSSSVVSRSRRKSPKSGPRRTRQHRGRSPLWRALCALAVSLACWLAAAAAACWLC